MNEITMNTPTSLSYFAKEINILNKLYSEECVNRNFPRLNEIFIYTERQWKEQLTYLPKEGIKYLFIAEAPPWSASGEIKYIYNPNSEPRTLLKALSKAFFGDYIYKSIGVEDTLKKLTASGLMIFDSLPFAMDYTAKRDRQLYKELVGACNQSYLLPKLNDKNLQWSDDLKIGFGFKKNGITIIEELNLKLFIDSISKEIEINSSQISANGAGYPDAKRIKGIFQLV